MEVAKAFVPYQKAIILNEAIRRILQREIFILDGWDMAIVSFVLTSGTRTTFSIVSS